MKVLTISPIYDQKGEGGVSKVIKSVCEKLAERGHRSIVLTLNTSSSIDIDEIVNLVEIKRLGSPLSKYIYGVSPALYTYLRTDKALALLNSSDIIHIHMYHNLLSVESVLLLSGFGKPIVFTPYFVGTFASKGRKHLHTFFRPLAKWAFKSVDKFICCAKYEEIQLQQQLMIPEERIKVIPLGVDLTGLKSHIKKANNSQRVSLLFVARLVEHKGAQYILRSMKILKDVYQLQPMLEIVGQGPLKNYLEKMVLELKLGDNVHWNTYLSQEELSRKYQEADIFLLPSRLEAYGLVVAEALSFGIPSIVAKTGALEEFTREPGCFGIDYPPNARKLAQLIVQIHNNDISVGPFNSFKIRSWDKVADEYEQFYGDLCKQRQ